MEAPTTFTKLQKVMLKVRHRQEKIWEIWSFKSIEANHWLNSIGKDNIYTNKKESSAVLRHQMIHVIRPSRHRSWTVLGYSNRILGIKHSL